MTTPSTETTQGCMDERDDSLDLMSFYLDAMSDAEEALRSCWAERSSENSPDCQKKIWSLEMKMRDQETLRAYWFRKLVKLGFTPPVACEWNERLNILMEY